MMSDNELEQVFSIFDEHNEGHIQLRRFVDIANNYYSDAEQLDSIVKTLDPENTGFINFEQFCEGIRQISSLQGLSFKEVATDLSQRSRENSLVEDSDRRSLRNPNTFEIPSLLWPNALQDENQDGSTTTFNEYDAEPEDVFHQSNKEAPVVFRTNSRKTSSLKPEINIQSVSNNLDSTFGDEEEFTTVAESDPTIFTRPTSYRYSQIIKRNSIYPPSTVVEPVDNQLQETVDELQKTVETLNEQKRTTTDRLTRIQTENVDLKSRLLSLEDRLQDLEGQHQRTTQHERQKYTEYINQKDRTFLEEKEILQSSVMRINAIEQELKNTQTNNFQMKKDVKELQQKLDDVDTQLQNSQMRCTDLAEDNSKLMEQLRNQREQLEAERQNNAQLAEQLKAESARFRFGRSLTKTESILKTSETRIGEMMAQIEALKTENERLRCENDELREKDLVIGVQQGRMLVSDPSTPSYAAELEILSKDELMMKVRDQYAINDRLRDYVEKMLSVIIEHNPQLLEVTTSGGVSIGMPSMSFPVSSKPKSIESQSNSISRENPDKYCRLS